MSWEQKILREQASAGQVHMLIPIDEFLTDGCFTTKDGHVAIALQLEPVPFETLDLEEADHIARRFEAALRVLNPAMRVYQYLFKRQISSTPHRPVHIPLLERCTEDRLNYLHQQKGPLFSFEIYLAVVFEFEKLTTAAETEIDRELCIHAHLLRTSVEGFREGLRGAMMLTVLHQEQTFRFLRRLLNYSPEIADMRPLTQTWDLADQLADSAIYCDGPLQVGRHHVRIYTLKSTPGSTYANMLRALYEIPCDLIIQSEWKALTPEKTQSSIHRLRRHLNHLTTSSTNFIGKSVRDHEILIDKGKQAQIEQLGRGLEAIQMENIYFGEFTLTILLYNEDPAQLRNAGAKACNAVHPHGAALSEHLNKAALAAWLSIIPGNSAYNVRELRITNVNYSDLSFLFGPHRGHPRNEHLKDESLAVLTTNQGTIFHLNLHQGQVGHTLLTGRTGAGKSYALKFLIFNALKYRPYMVIFDIARTFKGLTEAVGGSYVELGTPGSEASINPFCLPPTRENLEFLYSLVRMLIESDGGDRLGSEETADVYEQIKSIYTLEPEAKRLRNLGLLPHLEGRLGRWIRDGQYAHLFDNVDDRLSFHRFQTFAFPRMQQSPEALETLLFYVLHRSLELVWASEQPSFVIFDEGWTFLKHPATRSYIQAALKNFRKENASLILAAHSLADLDPILLQSVVESCLTRIHGPNPGINVDDWMRYFHMNRTQAEAIRSLVPERQLLIQNSGIVNLVAGPMSHALYNTSADIDQQLLGLETAS
jgi:type IV secretion system protein VirB4